MVKPVSDGSEYNRGYQQALNDFGITQLLSGIGSYSDEDFEAARAHESAINSVLSLFERAHAPTALNSSPACHPMAGAVVSFPFGVLWLLAPK
ncbi:hypothetical protein [Microcoleus sp. D3_18a_C4]|uniref:hypothetical protein n=1 Tax=Microcoleus sp. D3_18a_C4 TaxID=3055332 RepID=UPI002FD1399B